MASWEHRRQRIRVTLNGIEIPVADGVSVSEQLGNNARTAEFTLASEPAVTPAAGHTVLIELLDADADGGTVWPLFGGKVNPQEIESEPWGYVVRAVDQLELLRATNKSGDMNLTGMTDKEAWRAVADYCLLDYDPADIFDGGLILGERANVYWHDDASTNGAAIIADLDAVTGCATMTVGNNRVIRIPVDYVPGEASGLYATYEKGVSIGFSEHRRSRGDRDGIQNVWSVRGVTAQLSESCTAQPWAFAVSGNAQIGRKVRTATQSFSSDLIQDQDHAEQMVRFFMRRFNRVPDGGSATLENDPNVHPGSKIKIIDRQYGIETGAGGRLFCVMSVSRTGLEMSLELEAGPPGAEGTVTSGVDKVCGDVHTDPAWPGDFEWPVGGFPPLDPGDFIDLEDYFLDEPEFSVPPSGVELDCTPPDDLATCTAKPLESGQTITPEANWEAEGELTLTDQGERFELSIASDDGTFRFRLAGAEFYDPTVGAYFYELTTPSQAARAPGHAPLGQLIAWRVQWSQDAETLSLYADVGSDLCYIDSATAPGATFANAELTVLVTGTPTRSAEALRDDCFTGGDDDDGGGGDGGGGGDETPGEWGDWEIVSDPSIGYVWTTAWDVTTPGEASITTTSPSSDVGDPDSVSDVMGDLRMAVPDVNIFTVGQPARTRISGTLVCTTTGSVGGLVAGIVGVFSDQYPYASEGADDFAEVFWETLGGSPCTGPDDYDYAMLRTEPDGENAFAWNGLCIQNTTTFAFDFDAPNNLATATINGDTASVAWNPANGNYFLHLNVGVFDHLTGATWDFTDLVVTFGG